MVHDNKLPPDYIPGQQIQEWFTGLDGKIDTVSQKIDKLAEVAKNNQRVLDMNRINEDSRIEERLKKQDDFHAKIQSMWWRGITILFIAVVFSNMLVPLIEQALGQ